MLPFCSTFLDIASFRFSLRLTFHGGELHVVFDGHSTILCCASSDLCVLFNQPPSSPLILPSPSTHIIDGWKRRRTTLGCLRRISVMIPGSWQFQKPRSWPTAGSFQERSITWKLTIQSKSRLILGCFPNDPIVTYTMLMYVLPSTYLFVFAHWPNLYLTTWWSIFICLLHEITDLGTNTTFFFTFYLLFTKFWIFSLDCFLFEKCNTNVIGRHELRRHVDISSCIYSLIIIMTSIPRLIYSRRKQNVGVQDVDYTLVILVLLSWKKSCILWVLFPWQLNLLHFSYYHWFAWLSYGWVLKSWARLFKQCKKCPKTQQKAKI